MALEVSRLSPQEALEFKGLTYERYRHFVKNDDNRNRTFFSIGARLDGKPVGLALCVQYAPQGVELRSLFVLAENRRQGVVTELLRESEAEAVRRGCRYYLVLYQVSGVDGDAMEHLLEREGYGTPEFCALLGWSRNRGRLLHAPFLKKSLLPPSCEIFLWKDLLDEEREFIREKQEKETWYPAILSPFSNERQIEYLNSIGLRYRGEIAGWVITHRISPKLIRYTTSFVREDLQQYGFTAPLLIEAIKIHMTSPESLVATDASFVIPAQFAGMIAFARKRMLPYLEECHSLFKCIKNLG